MASHLDNLEEEFSRTIVVLESQKSDVLSKIRLSKANLKRYARQLAQLDAAINHHADALHSVQVSIIREGDAHHEQDHQPA